MKRLIACASLVVATTTMAVSSAAQPQHSTPAKKPAPSKPVARAPKCRIAPADEYFGKLKLSILGIRNTLKDQGLKVDAYPDKADTTLNAVALAEDATHDWQRKYPCDSWLPGTIYALEHFYTKIHTADGVKHVHAAYAWLHHDFPRDRIVAVALKEDGEAAVPAPNPVAAGGTAGAAAAADGAPATLDAHAAPAGAPAPQPGIIPAQSQATPVPGTAPASVINAQNAQNLQGTSPAPH